MKDYSVDHQELATHIDNRLDRIENKLDDHLERIAIVETSLRSIRGQVKLIIMAFMGAVAYVAKYIFDLIARSE